MLSVFGATYTAISALRGHYDKRVQQVFADSTKQAVSIKDASGDEKTAGNLSDQIATQVKKWNRSHAIPIGLFAVIAFLIGINCVVNWSIITASASALSANIPAGGGAATVKDASSSGQPATTQEYHVPQYWRWVLCVVLLVNGSCLAVALDSGKKIRSLGGELTRLDEACQKTKSKKSVDRGEVSPARPPDTGG
jgi:hypothetical protein